MDQASQTRSGPDEITFRDLVADVWRARVMILCVMAGCAIAGIAVGLLVDREYEASAVLSPVSEESAAGKLGGLGALASQYSGLASIAGITLPGGSGKEEAIAVLQSELLTGKYIRDNNLLPVLYSKMWDSAVHKWRTNDPQKVPTVWKANRYFKNEIRQVTEDRKTGLLVLSIRWKDPTLAAKWANDLVKMTNSYLREKAISEAQRNINYLNEQASKTTVVEAQRVIYLLLEQEVNKEMLARGREEYALKIIDPAFVPEKPSSPGPALRGLLGLALGGFAAILVVFARRAFLS